jgi:hypothetical protein
VITVGLLRKSAVIGLLAVGVLVAGLTGVASASSAGSPQWKMISISDPTNFKPGETQGSFLLMAVNVGGQSTDGSTVTITDVLPAGLSASSVKGFDVYKDHTFFGAGSGAPLTCQLTPIVSCEETVPVDPGDTLYMEVHLNEIGSELPPSLTNEASVTGGGIAPDTASTPVQISATPADFGLSPESVVGTLSTLQAGAHPDFTTAFSMNRSEAEVPAGTPPKDIRFDVPLGLVGNTLDIPHCSMAKVVAIVFAPEGCPRDSIVGMATIFAKFAKRAHGTPLVIVTPVYNISPAPGEPLAFGFNAALFPVRIDASVLSDGNYGARVTAPDISEGAETLISAITIWGVPADHNGPGQDLSFMLGGVFSKNGNPAFGGPGSGARIGLLLNPTQCTTPLTSTASTDSWDKIGSFVSQTVSSGTLTGCDQVPFFSSFSMLPDTVQAGAPAGYNYDLKIPREEDTAPEGLAEADVKKTVVKLPLGTVISPAAADGLNVCRDDPGVDPANVGNEFGLHSLTPASCDQAGQVGIVQISSPLLAKPLDGQVYLAQPECEPCTAQDAEDGKMVKLLLQARGEGSNGIQVKVEGSLSIDQQTGQLTATFDNTPQLPFDEFKLSIGGGSRAALANSRSCGPAITTTVLTPWTTPIVPDLNRNFSFEVTGCYAPKFEPFFVGGTTSNQAGGYSPATFSFGRVDSDEFLAGIKTQMPPGVLGMLSNVALCQEPQAAQGICGADSQIGHAQVLTGPGKTPFLVTSGKVFITGPYKGAPYGLSIVVPAKAGPYTIAGTGGKGVVVVRAAIEVDPHTAALTVTSDPFPTVLDGIPLQLQRVEVAIDRPEFVFNPTSCNKLHVDATITSTEGMSANVGSSFQVTNCGGLRFNPKFGVSTNGHTSRSEGASLDARLSYRLGAFGTQANIAKVKVSLPKQLPSRLTTLQKACPAQTFEANPAACPTASRIGMATATTPILPVALNGPVYFVSHGGEAFPDLVIVLQGYGVTVHLVGTTFINKVSITSTTFKTIPDVPVGSFELKLPQGPNSALAANGNLCQTKLKMPTAFIAQDGTQIHKTTSITVSGCAKHKVKKARRVSGHRKHDR